MIVLTLVFWNWYASIVIRLSFDIDKTDLAYLNVGDSWIRGLI